MLRHKNIGRISCAVLTATLLLTIGFMGAAALGLVSPAQAAGYEGLLFDNTVVHTVDIVMDDWDGFIETCEDEEYVVCTVVIDGEKYSNVAIRAKGNTSLSSVKQYGSSRYSFKLEFDHYDNSISYHGLDKLSLNNLIQDSTYMKDYVSYTMMRKMGVAAPLCSYVYITVNGKEWGLYLAVEGVEDGFIRRNYGNDGGEMYKPDSLSFGGGRGNGRDFDMEAFTADSEGENSGETSDMGGFGGGMPDMGAMFGGEMPDMGAMFGGEMPDMGAMFGGGMPDMAEMFGGEMPEMPGDTSEEGGFSFGGGFSMGGMGSGDVKLQYLGDDPSSYSNIFNNAVTDVSGADQTRLIASLKALSEGDTSVVDVDSVMRYMVVHDFVRNDDSYTGTMVHNYYLYEENGVLSMVPWDYNLAFGGFAGGNATEQINSPIDTIVSGDISSRPMAAWIFADDESVAKWHETYAEFVAEICESGWLDSEIVRVQELIAPYVEKDPTAFYSYDEFEKGVETMRRFCSLRAQSVAGQLDGTIPSDEESQRADSSAFITADDLNLSDMGSMGMGGGFGGMMGGRDRNSGEKPEQTGETAVENDAEAGENVDTEDVFEDMQMPEGMPAPDGKNMPEGIPEGMNIPEGMPGNGGMGGGNPFGSGGNPFGSGGNPFGSGENPFGGGENPFGSGENPFGSGENPFGRGENSFGGEGSAEGAAAVENEFGTDEPASEDVTGAEETAPEDSDAVSSATVEGSRSFPGMDMGSQPTAGGFGGAAVPGGNNDILLLAGSVIVLAAGLVIAVLFKGKMH